MVRPGRLGVPDAGYPMSMTDAIAFDPETDQPSPEREESTRRFDAVIDSIGGVASRTADRLGLSGLAAAGEQVLGHPVHPVLTDLPIGFWTSSWLLDLVGGRRQAGASRLLLGAGIASAVPTIAFGLGDLRHLDQRGRRVAVFHLQANSIALGLYTASFCARRGRRRALGVALGMAGAAAATVGGYLGGKLAFGSSE